MYNEKDFIKAISASFKKYKEFAELFENRLSMTNLFAEIENYKKYLLTVENK